MRRLLTILLAYLAASLAAMVVLTLSGWISSGSLTFERLGYVIPLLLQGAATGALVSLPIALPTILFTEFTRFNSVWIFAAAGVLIGIIILALIAGYFGADLLAFGPYLLRDLAVTVGATLAATMTYWLVAWRLYPPKPAMAPTGETFE